MTLLAILLSTALAGPFQAETADCATLPPKVAKALCTGDRPAVVRALGGNHTVYLGQHVTDETPIDGPYLVERVLWIDGRVLRGMDADVAAFDFLQGLGPVADRADAVARLRFFAWMRNGLDGAWPVDQEPTDCGDPTLPDERCGTTLVDTVYTATVLRHDDLSCECSTMWSKVIRDRFLLAADGTLTATETQVWCMASPESANDEVCGAGWRNPTVPP